MPLPNIRAATPADWPVIAEYNCRLAWESEQKQLDSNTVGLGVQNLLRDPARGAYLLAEVEGRVVGQMMRTLEWSDWRNGEIWWIQSVYVDPSHRRQGVYRSLYQALIEQARESPGVVGIRLYVERHNHRAQETYTALGMKPAGYEVFETLFTDH